MKIRVIFETKSSSGDQWRESSDVNVLGKSVETEVNEYLEDLFKTWNETAPKNDKRELVRIIETKEV